MSGYNNEAPPPGYSAGNPVPTPPVNAYPPNGQQQTNSQPMPDHLMNYQPMPGQSMTGQPMNGQPMNGQPMNGQPMNGQPMNGQPMNSQPMNGQPMNGQPMNGQSMNGQPMSGQPMNGQPMYGQPMNGQPMNGQPMNGQPGYGPQGPLTQQPISNLNMMMQQPAAPVQWMPRPDSFAGCPPGLEYLSHIDSLQVQQEVDLMEVFTMRHRRNRYKVSNADGLQVYTANEETEEWQLSYGNQRGWTIHVADNQGNEILRVMKDFSNCGAGCHCCAGSGRCKLFADVECPPGNRVGQIKQATSCMQPRFKIVDNNENVVLLLDGPGGCAGCCARDIQFDLKSSDGSHEIGKITKVYMGRMEAVTMADTFGVNFPVDLDVKVKALVLGALFLIDYRYFQVQHTNQQGRHR